MKTFISDVFFYIAKKLNVTKQSVSNWENGNIQLSIDMLIKIATVFSVSADYLLGLDMRSTIDVSNLNERQKSHIQAIVDDIRTNNLFLLQLLAKLQ